MGESPIKGIPNGEIKVEIPHPLGEIAHGEIPHVGNRPIG